LATPNSAQGADLQEILAQEAQIMPQAIGDGTDTSPKIITTAYQLAEVAVLVNQGSDALAKAVFNPNTTKHDADVYLQLGADIDLSAYQGTWTDPSGVSQEGGWVPIGDSSSFKAHFNGNGYVI
jgi:hypothetical protein